MERLRECRQSSFLRNIERISVPLIVTAVTLSFGSSMIEKHSKEPVHIATRVEKVSPSCSDELNAMDFETRLRGFHRVDSSGVYGDVIELDYPTEKNSRESEADRNVNMELLKKSAQKTNKACKGYGVRVEIPGVDLDPFDSSVGPPNF